MRKNPVFDIEQFNQPIRKNDLYVNTFSNHLKQHPFVEKPHRHNFYLMVLFTNGSGFHTIDFDRFEIQRGSLFLLQPGQMHHWELSDDIEGYIVFYSATLYNWYFANKLLENYPFYQSTKNSPELKIETAALQQLLPYFELMATENEHPGIKSPDKLLNLIDTVHIEINRLYQPSAPHLAHPYNHKIYLFRKLLEQHYRTEKSPAFYASRMSITLKHLNRISKELLNKTVTEIISARVILEAKRLLADPKRSVAQVADTLGFDNYPYFGKLFKKQTGISPGAFRKTVYANAK